jgi:NAD(P)-dependent dehydrogenase (short-subunit alcohol dehydrogenase family)
MSSLAGRRAVVTGASRGIGLEIARALAAEGARVAMLARGRETLASAARAIGASAVPVPCDVSDPSAVENTLGAIERELGGAPEILVNNAGLFELARVEDTTRDAFARALEVNLVGPFLLVRALLPAMREARAGDIVTIGSIADRVAFPENSAYAASKFGARALHEVLRLELQGSGVRATLISPGPVDTSLWDDLDPDNRPGFTPRARMLPASAVADAVRFAVTRPPEVDVEELRLART